MNLENYRDRIVVMGSSVTPTDRSIGSEGEYGRSIILMGHYDNHADIALKLGHRRPGHDQWHPVGLARLPPERQQGFRCTR